MKRLTILLLLCMATMSVQAQHYNQNIRPPRPKVGVVLGGGGAKGASHIGVLKYLEEMGIPVDYVAGTSMGSIIGGLYAMGYEPDEMTRLISDMNWGEYIGNKIDRTYLSKEMRDRRSTTLLNIPFGEGSLEKQQHNGNLLSQLPSAYVNNSSLVNLFNDLCIGYQEEMDFNDMPIPFACVATDLITGKEVVLRQGNVPAAMRASMAIPGVFAPVPWGEYVLVDGGLVNNFPADVLREMGADIIIGVEVTNESKVTADDLKSLPQVMGRILINGTSAKRKENRELCNVRIVPDITGFGMLSFTPEAIDTLVNRGYKRAAEYHDQLLAIKQSVDRAAGHPVSKELHAPRAHNLMVDSVFITSIDINGVSDRQSRWLVRKGGLKVGQTYSKDEIERAMSIYRGTGCFDEITYTVKERDSIHSDTNVLSDAYALTVNVKPASPHVMGLGLRYDTEEGAALLLNLNLNEKRFNSSELGVSAKLSYNPRIKLKYTYSRSSLANFNLTYEYDNEHFRIASEKQRLNLHYLQHEVSGYVSQFHLLNFSTAVGVAYSRGKFDLVSIDEDSPYDSLYFSPSRLLRPFIDMTYDNLDDDYFARHGVFARLGSHFFIDTKKNAERLNSFDICYDFMGYFTPGDGRFTLIPQLYGRYVYNGSDYFNTWNLIGGEIGGRHFKQQLPFVGITTVENFVSNTSIIRLDLRYNFYGKHYLTAMYNYAFDPYMVFRGAWEFMKDFSFHGAGLKYSYDSPIGPISLTGHWSNVTHQFGAYFSFGYTF